MQSEPRWCSASKRFVSHNITSFEAMIVNLCILFGLVSVAPLLFTPFLILTCSIANSQIVRIRHAIFYFSIFSYVYITLCIMGHELVIETRSRPNGT